MPTTHDTHLFPPLSTARLLLRPLTVDDTDFVFTHFSNPEVARFLLDEPPITTYAEAEEIVRFYQEPAGKSYNRWLLVRQRDHQPLGTCGYHKWDKRFFRAEIGYDLSPAYWGQGYMQEALRAVLEHGFAKMGLNRVEALVFIENAPSLRLLARLGFTQEGVLRDYFCLNGTFYDHALLSLLKREWAHHDSSNH